MCSLAGDGVLVTFKVEAGAGEAPSVDDILDNITSRYDGCDFTVVNSAGREMRLWCEDGKHDIQEGRWGGVAI